MNIDVRNGRGFDESDRGQSVAALSENAAKLLWPQEANEQAKLIGRRFMGEDDKVKTLVGIVAGVRASLQSEPPPMAYYPYWQRVPGGASLVVRTTAGPQSAATVVRSALRSEDPQLAIPAIRTMEELVDRPVA
ncbi:MAG: hypothetical protein HY646_01960 [Acidobacteria bacterium]|nr:hypothetical protein [Acidobacteriota bacterium]